MRGTVPLTRFTVLIYVAMSIRQIRISSPETIRTRISEFRGRTIQVVLESNVATTGILKDIDDSGIVLENRRLKKNRYAFHDIAEVYFDQVV